jgi:hypothetical protein
MTGEKAIRVGEKLPAGYLKMVQTNCPTCQAVFWIVHPSGLSDAKQAKAQVGKLTTILSGEHVDSNYSDHQKCYEDFDD